MEWSVLEESNPTARGLCHGCGLPSKLSVTAEAQRQYGPLSLKFCDHDCFLRWKMRIERLPNTGIKVG